MEEKRCSTCTHYEICANFQMYCHALKRRITARKQAKNCKYLKIDGGINNAPV